MYWQWTCERLNVQECLEGVPGRDLAAVDAMGLDRVQLARTGAGLVLKMVLEDGFFMPTRTRATFSTCRMARSA